MRLLRLLLFATAVLDSATACAQGTWDRYRPAKLDTVIVAHQHAVEAERAEMTDALQHQFWIIAEYEALLVRATYSGETRPISDWTRRLLQMWLKTLGIERHADLFDWEVLFIEDNIEHWLPVQTAPLAYMQEELSSGDEVALYLTFVGAHAGRSGLATWVFTVNEFDSGK